MHITRRKKARGRGAFLYLRHSIRKDGKPREQVLYLASEVAENVYEQSMKACKRRGYTPQQIEAILAAVIARVERNEHVPITVRGKFVQWRDPKKA